MSICWINGQFVSEAEAKLSIFDRGVLFGDGVYEVAAVFCGKLLDADLHLARLTRSLAQVSLDIAVSNDTLSEVMQSLATQNGISEGLVYLQVTRGEAERDFAFPATVKPTIFAFARAKSLSNDSHASGITAHAVPDIRWGRCDIKSTSMLAQVLAKQAARHAGAYEAMMHEDGVVTEGSSSTLWVVRKGVVYTRPLSNDILAGITRDVIISLASELGIDLEERAFTVDDACECDECFMTSATSFVLPIIQIDGRAVGSGQPGPVAARLREAYINRARKLTA